MRADAGPEQAPGTVWIAATVAGGQLYVTITDDGHGMSLRPDSPGLGLGLSVIAQVAGSLSITQGPGACGTEVALAFALDA